MADYRVGWWNLGNLFDTRDDPIAEEFNYTASDGWTPAVLDAKVANLADAIGGWFGGAGPDMLAVCEVENDDLFQSLCHKASGGRLQVVRDLSGTSDLRGIDVSLAVDPARFEVLSATSHVVHLRYATRDIFEVVLKLVGRRDRVTVIGCHLPSRKPGRYRTEPLRLAAAENLAFIVRDRLRLSAGDYERARLRDDLAKVQATYDSNVIVVGDFNDEPHSRSMVDHLQASSEIDRVVGPTNDIDHFESASRYRGDDTFLFNPCWKFLAVPDTGSYFIAGTSSGETFVNRYQMLDQVVVSRGLLTGDRLRFDPDSVRLDTSGRVATPSGRPRNFSRVTRKGTSDHLPLLFELRQ